MALVLFNVTDELRKFSRGRKTKVEPSVLLGMIVDKYLERLEGDDVDQLERLFALPDMRNA